MASPSPHSAPINPGTPSASPYQTTTIPYNLQASSTSASASRGRPRGGGAKRGRKPKNATAGVGTSSPLLSRGASPNNAASFSPTVPSASSPPVAGAHVRWAGQQEEEEEEEEEETTSQMLSGRGHTPVQPILSGPGYGANGMQFGVPQAGSNTPGGSLSIGPASSGMSLSGVPGSTLHGKVEDGEDGEDDVLPAMADDDYSAQLSWQSQEKDNLKVLMDNLSPEQYDRFEAYRRQGLPKQAIRKLIQQNLGQQVSQPVAQIVAGFAKVFVGEMVEKARTVQARRGERGPLSPDHMREAYRMYQAETGRVGAAKPLRGKRLFSK